MQAAGAGPPSWFETRRSATLLTHEAGLMLARPGAKVTAQEEETPQAKAPQPTTQ